MDKQNLPRIRNYLAQQDGALLLEYLQDYITRQACSIREPSEIKGMCELVQQIKNIPGEVEKYYKK